MNGKVEYRLVFASNIYADSGNHLRNAITNIIGTFNFGSLVLMFSSDGGSTDEALALFNFLSTLPVPVHMHAMGHVGSVSVPVFLAGSKRMASPYSRFFFHEFDWGFSQRVTLDRIEEAVQRLKSDIEITRKIFQGRAKLPPKLLKTLEGKAPPALITPQEAKHFGIVEDVCELPVVNADGTAIVVQT